MVYWNFRKAREYIIKRNIKNKSDWENYCKSEGFPEDNIPVNPENYYKKLGWKNFDHWIGFKLLPVIFALASIFPVTDNFSLGLVSPMPTLLLITVINLLPPP